MTPDSFTFVEAPPDVYYSVILPDPARGAQVVGVLQRKAGIWFAAVTETGHHPIGSWSGGDLASAQAEFVRRFDLYRARQAEEAIKRKATEEAFKERLAGVGSHLLRSDLIGAANISAEYPKEHTGPWVAPSRDDDPFT